MKRQADVLFFDLFFTLVTPEYGEGKKEYDVLGVTQAEWERYAEDAHLYQQRATGAVTEPIRIVEAIVDKMNRVVLHADKQQILQLRERRFARALTQVDGVIVQTLTALKNNGKRLCLVSNADVIDVMHWAESPLYPLFDAAVFSYQTQCLKPQKEIYRIAMERMKVSPECCVFIGDGGSEELRGAKECGMRTVMTLYLTKREKNEEDTIAKFADDSVNDFRELITLNNKIY